MTADQHTPTGQPLAPTPDALTAEDIASLVEAAGEGYRDEIAQATARIVAKHVAAQTAEARRIQRKATARAWSAFLDLAATDRLDDGTPLLQVVFEQNPGLRNRLAELLGTDENGNPCQHDWMRRGHDEDPWRECFLCGAIIDGWGEQQSR